MIESAILVTAPKSNEDMLVLYCRTLMSAEKVRYGPINLNASVNVRVIRFYSIEFIVFGVHLLCHKIIRF